MNSIGVVVLRNAKILQDTSNSTNISNNDRKPKREFFVLRKKQKIPTPTVSVASLVRAVDGAAPARAPKRPRANDDASTAAEGSPGPAPPLAVARRNARERNRVRQVNNGFAALRRHIPDEVAEAFETANSNRGPNKKLSKVETLRMAVEYIRNLESLLNIGESSNKENSTRIAMESFPSPASSSPRERSFERSYFSLHSPSLDGEEDEEFDQPLSSTTEHRYARNLKEKFYLTSTLHFYDEDEHGQPTTPASDIIAQDSIASSPLLDANFHFMNSAEQFTVIHPDQGFGTEVDANLDEDASNLDVKYAETLRFSSGSQTYINEIPNGLNTRDPQLALTQDQYKFGPDDIPISFVSVEESEALELKREVSDVHLNPEDRQQFEETLKWWQEKTKLSRPVKVCSEKLD